MSGSYAPTAPPGSGRGSRWKPFWIVLVVIVALSAWAAVLFKSGPRATEVPGGEGPPVPPPSTPASVRTIREAFWNNWIHDPKNLESVSALEVEGEYEIIFDLAAFNYETRGNVPSLATLAVAAIFREELDRYPGKRVAIRVKPVLAGRGLDFLPGQEETRTVEIDLDRLRNPPRDWSPEEPIEKISDKVRAASIRIGVRASEKGCASIGLSIWNNALDRPIEHVVRNVNVGGNLNDPGCVGKDGGNRPMQSGRIALLTIRPDRLADAALDIFEMAPGSGRPTSHAVFSQREDQQLLSWTLERQLSKYVTEASGLLNRLAVARSGKGYQQLADELTDVLFHGNTPKGQKDADRAKAVLVALASRRDRPTIFVRIADVNGRNGVLPLGLLAIGNRLLGDVADVAQPLPRETYAAEGRCIESWRAVLPNALSGVQGTYLKPVVSPIPNRISAWSDLFSYLRGSPPGNGKPEGVILLAHQSGGRVWFIDKSPDSIVSDRISRQFPAGSVAVLAACEVGALSAESSGVGLLEKLNELGIDAAIVSPFAVRGTLGSRFAFHFANELAKARRGRETAEFGDLFRRAVEETKIDGSVAAERNGVNEFLLAGNSGLRLCP